MRQVNKAICSIMLTATVIFAAGGSIEAQKTNEFISATAMGTSTQLGRVVSVDLRIFEYSPPADQGILMEAFQADGSQGLASALDKMSSKGRMAVTGTIGYDVNYIRKFTQPDGTVVLRFVTDRPVRFGEAWASTRSMDYNISVVQIVIKKGAGKGAITGTLMPAVLPKLTKKGELELETYQNPWNLTNIRIHK